MGNQLQELLDRIDGGKEETPQLITKLYFLASIAEHNGFQKIGKIPRDILLFIGLYHLVLVFHLKFHCIDKRSYSN